MRLTSRVASSECLAQVEEGVVDGDPLHAEHFGEQRAEDLLAGSCGEVDLGGGGAHLVRRGGGARQPQGVRHPGLGRVVERQRDLEERVPGEGTLGGQLLHQPLERHVLVGVRGQVGLPDAGDQLGEGRVAGGVGAQHERVDEQSDHVGDGVVGAARDGRAHRDVGARAEPGEEGGQARLEHHEQAGAGLVGQSPQPGVQTGRDLQRHLVAVVGGGGGAGPVGGQVQLLRRAVERVAPVPQLAGQRAVGVAVVAEDPALPEGVVGVLHGQRLPVGPPSVAAGRVGGGQVAADEGHRPAVAGDVVHEQDEHMLPRGAPRGVRLGEQVGPHRGFGADVEGPADRFGDPLVQFPARGGLHVELRCRAGVQDDLVRSLGVLGVHGPQGLVPGHGVGEGLSQRAGVEGPGDAERGGDRVRGGGPLEAFEEPQPCLRERQRQPRGPRVGGGDRAAAAVGAVEDRGEPGRGGRLEDLPDRHLGRQGGADPVHQPGDEQRVAAEGEEVVVDGDRGQAQHLGEQTAQQLLVRGARGPARAGSRGVGGGGRGQRPAVQLAVGGQRQGVEGYEGGRHHVVRERRRQVAAQRRRIRGRAVLRYDVADEPPVARGVLAHDDGGAGDVRVAGQPGGDLARLDAEAADLHLVVGPAEVLQVAVGVPAGQVAGAVHALAGLPERAGHEALGGQGRPVPVTAGESGAGDVQLAGGADGHGAQAGVEHVGAGVGDGAADGRGAGPGLGVAGHRVGRDDVGLGGPVVVVQQATGPPGVIAAYRAARGQGLAGLRDVAQAGQVEALFVGGPADRVHDQVRGVQLVGADAVQPGGQGVGVAAYVLRAQGERLAVQQGRQDLLRRHVEADRRELRGDGAGAAADGGVVPLQQVHHGLGRHHDGLGPAGGAGGVDGVGGVAGQQRRGPLGVGDVAVGRAVTGAVAAGHLRFVAGEHERRPAVGEHERGAFGGLVGGDGQPGGTGLEDREERHHPPLGAGHGEGDAGLGPDAAADEVAGEPVGSGVELPVRERVVPVEDGGRVRGAGGLPLEQGGQGGRGHVPAGGVPLLKQQAALTGGEQIDRVHRPVAVGGDGLDEPQQPLGDPVGGGAVEQVAAELEGRVDPGGAAVVGAPLGEGQQQVEAGHTGVDGHGGGGEAGQRAHPGVPHMVVEDEQDLEERVPGG
ncbi:hypothetical protein SGRIM128S_07472 [Streptomyces griseomycini]